MRKECLSQLENVLKLRRENSDVEMQFELSIKSIKNIGFSLTADHIVHNNFSGIAEARLAKLKSIENYEHSSLDKINRDFSSQSNELESIWKQHLKIKSYLANLEIFNGLKEKVKENEQKYHAAKNIEEVKECTVGTINSQHVWIADLIREEKTLKKIASDVQNLSKILNSLPIFEKLLEDLKNHENNMREAKSIETINSNHTWFCKWLNKENVLKYISREISKFRKFFKNSPFFKEDKWVTSLEKDCANAKDSTQIEKLRTKIKARKKILNTISKISSDWLKMHKNLSQIYTDPSAAEHDLFDKDRINIINELSSLEKQSKLDYESAVVIHIQLEKKINSWIKIKEKPYPSLGFLEGNDTDGNIVILVIANIFVLFINIFLFFCIWPFTYFIRDMAKEEIMKKPVLDW